MRKRERARVEWTIFLNNFYFCGTKKWAIFPVFIRTKIASPNGAKALKSGHKHFLLQKKWRHYTLTLCKSNVKAHDTKH